MKLSATATTTRVRVADRQMVETAFERAHLSRDEELVLRLRHGLAVSPETALAFRDGASPEMRARLALMEISAIEHMADTEAARQEAAEEEAREAATQSVIERLRRL